MKKPKLLVINEKRHEVFVRGKRVHLSPNQFRILVALRADGGTISREDILSKLHGEDHEAKVYTRTVDQQVMRLRKALKINVIETVVDFGYKYTGS